jgi:hypothetical protein
LDRDPAEKPDDKKTCPTTPDPMERHLQCPNCGARLFNRSCKWWCSRCNYHESCADM